MYFNQMMWYILQRSLTQKLPMFNNYALMEQGFFFFSLSIYYCVSCISVMDNEYIKKKTPLVPLCLIFSFYFVMKCIIYKNIIYFLLPWSRTRERTKRKKKKDVETSNQVTSDCLDAKINV